MNSIELCKWIVCIMLIIGMAVFMAMGIDATAWQAITGSVIGILFGLPAAGRLLTKLQGK